MNKIATILVLFASFLIIYLSSAVGAPRPNPSYPVRVDNLLLLDAARAGNRIISVGERAHIFLSDDNGKTWGNAKSQTEVLLTAVFFYDEKHGWAVGHDAVILRSEDSGNSWQQSFSAPKKEEPLFDVWFRNKLEGFAVGAYGSFYLSQDGGKTWQGRQVLQDDMHINAVAGGTDGKLFIVGEAGTFVALSMPARLGKCLLHRIRVPISASCD